MTIHLCEFLFCEFFDGEHCQGHHASFLDGLKINSEQIDSIFLLVLEQCYEYQLREKF